VDFMSAALGDLSQQSYLDYMCYGLDLRWNMRKDIDHIEV
jgi:hypothetical protein